MLNIYPDDYYCNDMDRFYLDPRSSQQQLRRAQLQRAQAAAAAVEEERRRRMLYEKAMREENIRREEAMRRREEIIMEQRSRRAAEQKRREEMMARRQALLEQSRRDAEKRRRILERQWQQQRQRELELERQLAAEDEQRRAREQNAVREHAKYGIVRGPDGRLYKLNADGDGYNTSFGGAGPGLRGSSEGPMVPQRVHLTHPWKKSERDSDEEVFDASLVAKKEKGTRSKKSNSVRKVKTQSSVLIGGVEDASDSEQEEELSSIWRNRMPSEGEWMEPVKGYDVHW